MELGDDDGMPSPKPVEPKAKRAAPPPEPENLGWEEDPSPPHTDPATQQDADGDEDEGTEDQGPAEAAGNEGDEEELGTPAPKKGAKIDPNTEIELDDGTRVTFDEMRKGYLRKSDHSRRVNEIQAERQEVRQYAERVVQDNAQVRNHAEVLAMVAQQLIPPEPDPRLVDEDVVEYGALKTRRDLAIQRFNAAQYALNETRKVQAAEQQQQINEVWAKARRGLAERMPELTEPAKMAAFKAAATPVLAEHGFAIEELMATPDPRMFGIVKDLIAFNRYKSGLKKAAEATKQNKNLPPVSRPGVRKPQSSGPQAAVAQAIARVKKTHSAADGLAALMKMED